MRATSLDFTMFAFFLCLALTAVCVLLHYETLRLLNDRLASTNIISMRAKVLAALVGALASHVLQIGAFALAYYLLRDKFGMGGFGGTFQNTLMSFLYFSSETYTTLGFGDIYPTGSLRMICGIESLIGLLMVSWTASFTYSEMRRYW
ncbi:MAG TPA: potassium channel family protein [Burkholderiales bacterium]|nr:potassium channel family protein [Burkholderiales bacterium]